MYKRENQLDIIYSYILNNMIQLYNANANSVYLIFFKKEKLIKVNIFRDNKCSV